MSPNIIYGDTVSLWTVFKIFFPTPLIGTYYPPKMDAQIWPALTCQLIRPNLSRPIPT